MVRLANRGGATLERASAEVRQYNEAVWAETLLMWAFAQNA
jgi:hypothetical protein